MLNLTTIKLAACIGALGSALFLGIYVGKGIEKGSSEKKIAEVRDNLYSCQQTVLEIQIQSQNAIESMQSQINEAAKNANEQVKNLELDLDRAESASDGLRDKARRLEDQYRKCANPAKPSATTTETPYLLSDMLDRIDRASGEIAEYADRVTIAHDACIASYNAK